MGKWFAAAAFLLTLGTQVAFAQMPPAADSMIEAVYSDIDRYEGWYKSNPSKNTAKRVLKFLKLSEGRLARSSHQDDPSWQAANERLAMIKEEMTALLEGRQPRTNQQAAPAQQQPAPVQSSDPKVQAAAADIARISGQVDQLQPGDMTTAQKYLDELKQIGNTLRGVANKDAGWKQAAQDFNALQQRIVQVANQPAPAGASKTAQQPAQQQQPAQAAPNNKPDPNTERAMREMKFAERNVNNLRADDVRGEQRVLADLNRINQSLNAVQDQSHPSWQEAKQYLGSLYKALADKRIGAIEKALDKIEKSINNSPSVQFLDSNLLAKMNNILQAYDHQLQVYAAFKDDPTYKATFDRPQQIAELMDKKAAEAKAEESELGDVEAEVAAIEARMKAAKVPATLNGQKITLAKTKAYVEDMQALDAQVKQDIAYLQKIKGRTDKIDKQRMQRLNHWVGSDLPRKMERSLQESKAIFGAGSAEMKYFLEFHAKDDPQDPNHQSNRFLGKDVYANNLKTFDEDIDWVKAAMLFEATYGPDNKAEREQMLATLEQAKAKYMADYKVAVGAVRLTKGVDDDELREIARKVLESGRYEGVGEIVRIETTKKTHREETRGTISGTTTGASINASKYSWDEFQAHTIEKQGDQYFIYHSTMKYFYSGGTKTPLDRWLVAGRFKSNPILEENIDK